MSIQRGGVVEVRILSPRMTDDKGSIRKLTEQEKVAYVSAACQTSDMRDPPVTPVNNADTCRCDGDEWSAESLQNRNGALAEGPSSP